MRQTLSRWSAAEIFYPAAACYAALVLPVAVLAMTGRTRLLPALADPLVHAHEMLVGFALAVVAGNQLGSARGRFVAAMLLLWLAARATSLFAPTSLVANALDAAFAAALAARVVPRLLGAAKKWRNRALPAVITAIASGALAWAFTRYAGEPAAARALVHAMVLLFATLMLFMGGRLIAPAVAGQLYRQRLRLDARVQPRLEAALLVASGAAAVLSVVPRSTAIAAGLAALAGIVALVRLARWRLWLLRGRPDLLCLAAGYAWLGLGLLALGAAMAIGAHVNAAIHVITVGALGTLTFSVMASLWMSKTRHAPAHATGIVWGTVLIALSTALRVLGAFVPGPWLLLSALSWSSAFGVLLILFWRTRRQSPRRRAEVESGAFAAERENSEPRASSPTRGPGESG
ncbi:MAG: NnrS family protein [Burkholderiales bacterium]|nr:NnrS family protein [Burkholderiales bacterium]